jgi:hypothetical protein
LEYRSGTHTRLKPSRSASIACGTPGAALGTFPARSVMLMSSTTSGNVPVLAASATPADMGIPIDHVRLAEQNFVFVYSYSIL